MTVHIRQYGRYRSNVWHYPGVNSFSRSTEEGNLLALHSTIKPAALVADAIMDCSGREGARGQSTDSATAAQICSLIEAGKLDELRWPDCSSYRIQVEQFYRSLRFELAWVQQRHPTQQANAMIELFQTAEKKGLEPGDYDASLWSARLNAFAASSTNSDELARFDFALTVSSLRYLSDLYQGKVSPRECQVNLPEKDFEVAQFLRNEVIHASNVSAAFQKLEPAYEATGEHS